ncbi:DUF2075 domain-containing protein [Novosphingobium sp. Fuku2-ISO-50]|uniref:DUF2075 domain-containing protein n=1 Tax=Novosphingobium sp. Fuku2-ISO-50 TaxID=1739114 RepID=UPI00076D3750|nr:DUF2075 domain-containing protein [Novosphingobium sp. Fuku2-ISO-50]KUR78336.1 hypothetical protein AQZ50_07305 [Novosphingobium sp. Fuku2-ISO-50]
MSVKAYYLAPIAQFCADNDDRILGVLTSHHHHALDIQQRFAWSEQINILKYALSTFAGTLLLECYVPRMGKRADAVALIGGVVFVLEFKVGAQDYGREALAQVEDYALDLKNFHEGSHLLPIAPVLIATNALSSERQRLEFADDMVAAPLRTNAAGIEHLVRDVLEGQAFAAIDEQGWLDAGYKPTPTIIEAAQTLYRTHSVVDIARSDASAKNLQETSASVSAVIDKARSLGQKAICFVTGVPGSGKTLAGLNIATRRSEEHLDEHAVFLSGNGPLVDVLREALARDKAVREGVSKAQAERAVRSFVQNIHHFRDHYVGNADVPTEKVVVFDEAQRAWTREQASSFMQRKRGQSDFDVSEPEFLISVMDRHPDWCAIVCLVGGGQEINTGEAGISEWIHAIEARFPHWTVHVSPRITLPDYSAGTDVRQFLASSRVRQDVHLHLAVSMRSFRAEALSDFVGYIVDNDPDAARSAYDQIRETYPIYLTRELGVARAWLRQQARGTERFGLVASSGAQRLRPIGVYVKAAIDPPNWFLNDAMDVRSSFYLEEVASEFDVQGLELDWMGVCWDGDFHHNGDEWVCQAFKGRKWQSVREMNRRLYLKNAYRVILTRARQGMIIVVPDGDADDWTRPGCFYDGTFGFLKRCGLPALD